MTILFAGGEDTSVTFIGTAASSTGSFAFDAAFSRAGLNVPVSATDPPTSRIQTAVFSSVSAIWVRAFVGNNSAGAGTTNNQQAFRLLSPDGNPRVLLRTDGSSHLKVTTRTAAGTLTDVATSTATVVSVNGAQTRFPVDMFVDYTATGGAQVYFNGIQFINFSGDLRTDAATLLNRWELGGVYSTQCWWSELVASDASTLSTRLWTLAPQAAGNTQGWTPNTLANINEATINDATLISTGANNTLSEWTTPTTAPGGTWSVRAIVQDARIQVGTTGPQHFDWVVRTASTDFTAGVSNAPGNTFSNFNNQLWATNPNTSAAWSITDIAAGFNLGIKSLA